MKRNKLVSLLLALILCISLSAPASAAKGEKKVFTEGCFQITMDGFLRVETYRYYSPTISDDDDLVWEFGYDHTFYVVADNSTVTVETAPGYRYATDYFDRGAGAVSYPMSGYAWLETNQILTGWGGGVAVMTEPLVFTADPQEGDIIIHGGFGVQWICESDFERLASYPYRGEPKADHWAQGQLEHSFNLGLFPDGVDPFQDDCTRAMTRGEFAEVLLKLYRRLGGSVSGLSRNTPFTDLPADVHGYIPLAYNLGLVEGTSATTFSPDDPLTREQAAVMLCRVYEKFYSDFADYEYYHYQLYRDKDQISPWAQAAVSLLYEENIMEGVSSGWGGGTFAPQRILTLQEGMVIVQRMLDHICSDRHYPGYNRGQPG